MKAFQFMKTNSYVYLDEEVGTDISPGLGGQLLLKMEVDVLFICRSTSCALQKSVLMKKKFVRSDALMEDL